MAFQAVSLACRGPWPLHSFFLKESGHWIFTAHSYSARSVLPPLMASVFGGLRRRLLPCDTPPSHDRSVRKTYVTRTAYACDASWRRTWNTCRCRFRRRKGKTSSKSSRQVTPPLSSRTARVTRHVLDLS
jgi:hypothetical protein